MVLPFSLWPQIWQRTSDETDRGQNLWKTHKWTAQRVTLYRAVVIWTRRENKSMIPLFLCEMGSFLTKIVAEAIHGRFVATDYTLLDGDDEETAQVWPKCTGPIQVCNAGCLFRDNFKFLFAVYSICIDQRIRTEITWFCLLVIQFELKVLFLNKICSWSDFDEAVR